MTLLHSEDFSHSRVHTSRLGTKAGEFPKYVSLSGLQAWPSIDPVVGVVVVVVGVVVVIVVVVVSTSVVMVDWCPSRSRFVVVVVSVVTR